MSMSIAFEDVPFGIDRVGGGLAIKGLSRLNRSTTLHDLHETLIVKDIKEQQVGNGWSILVFSLGPFGSVTALFKLYFHDSFLQEIHVAFSEGREASSWKDWSETAELRRKEMHDNWLLATLGPGPYTFEWGEVLSEYDAVGGFSEVIIRLANDCGVKKKAPSRRDGI